MDFGSNGLAIGVDELYIHNSNSDDGITPPQSSSQQIIRRESRRNSALNLPESFYQDEMQGGLMAESERAYYDVHLDHAEMGTKKKDSGPVHWIGKKVRFASAQNQQQKGNMKTLIHALDNGFLWSLWRNSGFTTKFFFFSAFGLNSVEAFFLVWYSIHYSMVSPVIVFHFLNHSFHFLLMGVFGHGARMEVSERSGGGVEEDEMRPLRRPSGSEGGSEGGAGPSSFHTSKI